MIKFLRLSVLIIPVILFFVSCSDSPSSVGIGLIQDQDKLSFTQLDSQTDNLQQTSYTYQPADFKIANGNKFILGRTNYAESKVLLRFDLGLPDSSWTKFKNNTTNVKSAKVLIKTSYLLGDKNAPFDFTVHQITNPWNMYSVDKDSLIKLTSSNIEVSSNHEFTDSTIAFNIDKSVITQWLNAKLDTNNTRDYGIILSPTSSTQKMRGFTNPFSSTNYVILSFELERNPVTSENDTLSVVPSTGTFIVKELQAPTSNSLVLQSGYSRRNFLWFDLAKLPKNIIVSKAILDLTNDPQNSIDGDPSSSYITATILADSSTKKYTADSLYSSGLSKSGDVYSGDISWMIQKWAQGTDNQGIELVLTDERSATSRIALYGSKVSDIAKRPRLKIYYTKK